MLAGDRNFSISERSFTYLLPLAEQSTNLHSTSFIFLSISATHRKPKVARHSLPTSNFSATDAVIRLLFGWVTKVTLNLEFSS
jgi:hypothetical protein